VRRRKPRVIAICLFLDGERFLVLHGHDSQKQSGFRRPLGGAVEYGESSEAAIRREIREELGCDIVHPKLLGVLENLFVYEGEPGHEIVFVYDAVLADRELYERAEFGFTEVPGGPEHRASWMSLADFDSGEPRLVPEGLPGLIRGLLEGPVTA